MFRYFDVLLSYFVINSYICITGCVDYVEKVCLNYPIYCYPNKKRHIKILCHHHHRLTSAKMPDEMQEALILLLEEVGISPQQLDLRVTSHFTGFSF